MLSQKTRSSLTITIGTILVVIGTLLLVAFASGYNFDILSGEIYTTGLALLNTNPSGATIKVNDRTLSQKTPYRLENIKTGSLDVEYSKADYHSWKTSFFVRSGEVTFADYALLIPTRIEPRQIDSEQNFAQVFNSTDATKAFSIGGSPVSLFEIKEDNQLRKVAEIPLDTSFKPSLSTTLAAINTDGSAIVLQANYEAGSALFWVNTNSGEVVNLSSFLKPNTSQIKFNLRNNRELFGLHEGNLQRINVNERSVDNLPLANITSFNVDNDNLYCLENLSPAANGQFYVRYDLNANNRYVLAQFPESKSPWTIQLSKLNGQSASALTEPETKSLFVVRQQDGKFLNSNLGSAVQSPLFSRNGRFLSYEQNGDLKSIDLEFIERYREVNKSIKSLSWLSDFQLLITKPDGLYIVDYTGQNLIKIPPNTSVSENIQITTDKNNKIVYFIQNSKLHSYKLEPPGGLINFR